MAPKKSMKKETAVETTPVVSDTDTKATKMTKTTKAPKTPKTTTEVVPEMKTDNTVIQPTVTESNKLTEQFTDFMAKFQSLMTTASLLKSEFRALEKATNRELKAAQKANAKKKRKNGNRSPSGFVKPTLISSELATFLGKPSGTEMARTEVTREINHYIRQHNLQDKENGRKINPDKQLATLLKIQSGDELTYFNLQRYMSPHFAKATATATA